MPQPSTLSFVADWVIRRVMAEADASTDLAQALERAYPFDDSMLSRRIWLDALLRHAAKEDRSDARLAKAHPKPW